MVRQSNTRLIIKFLGLLIGSFWISFITFMDQNFEPYEPLALLPIIFWQSPHSLSFISHTIIFIIISYPFIIFPFT